MPPKSKGSFLATPSVIPSPTILCVDEKCSLVAGAFPTDVMMNESICRISWFYENKIHKGKYLSLAEWAAIPRSKGLFPVGHNFPAAVLLKWLQLAPAEDWSMNEKVLFSELMARKLLAVHKGTWSCTFHYIIAGVYNDHETFRHELMHAFYFANLDYRELVTNVLTSLPSHVINFVTTYMKSKGYTPEVLEDEFQAYLCCDDPGVVGGPKAAETKPVVEVKQRLRTFQRDNLSWGEVWRRFVLEGGVLDLKSDLEPPEAAAATKKSGKR